MPSSHNVIVRTQELPLEAQNYIYIKPLNNERNLCTLHFLKIQRYFFALITALLKICIPFCPSSSIHTWAASEMSGKWSLWLFKFHALHIHFEDTLIWSSLPFWIAQDALRNRIVVSFSYLSIASKLLQLPNILSDHQQKECQQIAKNQSLIGYHRPTETIHHQESYFWHHYQNQIKKSKTLASSIQL